jgi:hypothetical protein
MNMTLDELVNAQIRDYLSSEDFIDKYDTQQIVKDEINCSSGIQKVVKDEINSSHYINEITDQTIEKLEQSGNFASTDYVDEVLQGYVTEEYVDEEIRQQVRCVIDEDEYATEAYVDAKYATTEYVELEVSSVIRDEITKLRKELYLEGLVPAEKQKPVNQLDQFVSPDGLIAGYPDWDTLTSFVGASLSDPSQKHMVVAMVLATARNIIQEQLNNDHKEIRG